MHNNLQATALLSLAAGRRGWATTTATAATTPVEAWWGSGRTLDAVFTLVVLDVTILTILTDADGAATKVCAVERVDGRCSLCV